MCSKKELIKHMNNEKFWINAGIQKSNIQLVLLSKKITSLLSDNRLKWDSKKIEPHIQVNNDLNCINFVCENSNSKLAKIIFNMRDGKNLSISACTRDRRMKKCYINITWEECINMISDVIS